MTFCREKSLCCVCSRWQFCALSDVSLDSTFSLVVVTTFLIHVVLKETHFSEVSCNSTPRNMTMLGQCQLFICIYVYTYVCNMSVAVAKLLVRFKLSKRNVSLSSVINLEKILYELLEAAAYPTYYTFSHNKVCFESEIMT